MKKPSPKNTSWDNDSLEELQANLQYLDDCRLECDGMTYAIASALQKANITHKRMVGHVYWNPGQSVVDPHCWIELSEGAVIDFRLRLWLGDDDEVPHGIFKPDPLALRYVGQEQTTALPNQSVLDLMTDGRLSKLKLHSPVGYQHEHVCT